MESWFSGSFGGELALTVLGGVVTGLILEMFRGGRRAGQQQRAPARERRGDSFFGGLARLILAVAGGAAIAFFLGRYLFTEGILPRSPATRIGLLVLGTAFCWTVLLAFRRR